MGIIDWVVIGIIAIGALIGLAKGFFKLLFTICKGFIALIGAYLLCKPVANWALTLGFSNTINTKILEWVSSKGEVFAQPVTDGAGELIAQNLGLPEFLSKYIADAVNKLLPSLQEAGVTLGEAVANTFTYYCVLVLSFIVLLIILSIAVVILSKLLTKAFDGPILKPINKLLGLVLGAAIGVIIVCLVFSGAAAITGFVPQVQEFIEAQVRPTETEFGIARYLYNHNVINIILSLIANPENLNWEYISGALK